MYRKKLVMLVADDSKHDIEAVKRAWKCNMIENELHFVQDGEECLDYLSRHGKYRSRARSTDPSVLILDAKMPRLDGLGVLQNIRESEEHKLLPVVMFTSSREDEIRRRAYEIGANAYVRKPPTFREFSEMIHAVNMFWELTELPQACCSGS